MATADDDATAQKKLIELSRKRLERFVTFAAKVLVNDDPETIHDLRVWSRRLQQTLRVIVPAKTPARRKTSRTLRRIRKAFGPCRNIDVNLELVKARLEEAGSPALKCDWETFAAYLRRRREPSLAAARRKLRRCDLMLLIERAQKLIGRADRDVDPSAKLRTAAARSMAEWDAIYALAVRSRSIERFHALRIATKRLRYRAEILSDSGLISLTPMVRDLKEIQAALGDWHDRWVLLESVGGFIARPKFLAKHADARNALRARVEKEQKDNAATMEALLHRAAKMRTRWDRCPAGAS